VTAACSRLAARGSRPSAAGTRTASRKLATLSAVLASATGRRSASYVATKPGPARPAHGKKQILKCHSCRTRCSSIGLNWAGYAISRGKHNSAATTQGRLRETPSAARCKCAPTQQTTVEPDDETAHLSLTLQDGGELPGEVVRVLDASVHAKAPGGREPVRRVARQQHVTF